MRAEPPSPRHAAERGSGAAGGSGLRPPRRAAPSNRPGAAGPAGPASPAGPAAAEQWPCGGERAGSGRTWVMGTSRDSPGLRA